MKTESFYRLIRIKGYIKSVLSCLEEYRGGDTKGIIKRVDWIAKYVEQQIKEVEELEGAK